MTAVGQHGGVGLREVLVARGHANGLDAVGVCEASPFLDTRSELRRRKAAGLSADMEFTFRNPERSTDPSRTLAGARSLVVGAVRYASRTHDPDPDPARPDALDDRGAEVDDPEPVGRVARYAVGDQDQVLRSALAAVAADLRHAGFRAVVLSDDNALVDRAAAHRAGIGWFGKNANLLLPGRGSWFVLGAVLTDAEIPASPAPVPDGCGTCRRCLDLCPTQAIVAEGVVDARRCLSWLLQSPGEFPHEHRVALGDRLYGCDDCQEVCPPNRLADRRHDGPRPGLAQGTARIDVRWMLEADDDELDAATRRWYVPGRDADHLRRNALLVLGNTADGGDPGIGGLLGRYLRHGDDNLVAHATWAALRIGRVDLLDDHVEVRSRPVVVAEQERWRAALAAGLVGETG